VKTTLIPALVAIGWIGLLANVQAVAQYGPSVSAVASQASPVSQNAPTAQGIPDNQVPNSGTQAPNGTPTVAPGATPNPTADDSLLLDNGLWEGASVGPCCAKCGGGSGCPPDWYTLQGVRIISRSKTRDLPISFQSPTQGNFALVASSDFPGYYNVFNAPGSTTNGIAGVIADRRAGVMSAKSLGLDVATGYNATIGHYFCRDRNNNDHFVEFTFWGLNSWSDSKTTNSYLVPVYNENAFYTTQEATLIGDGLLTPATVSGQLIGSLRTPYPTPLELPGGTLAQQTLSLAFNNGIEHDISYQSTMNNFELNGRFSPRGQPDRLVLHPDGKWQRECQPGRYMSYLYGLRFMQIDETFKFHSLSQGLFQNSIETASGNYDIVTRNDLLGLQIGAELQFRKCRWSWGVEAKMGPYINFANQVSTINASINGLPQNDVSQRLVANRYEASLIGEVGFEATYKFRPNLMGRAAYDFMWVTGLALAPEQLQFVADPVNRINVNGGIFSQGVSLGLEWMW
jgi:hypothetical protein